MVFLNGPARDDVTKTARPGLLQLMGSHSPGRGEPAALLEVVDAYLTAVLIRIDPEPDSRHGRTNPPRLRP